MTHQTYLGQKGYSIYKKTLSLEEQIFIRNELTMRAYIPKSPVQPTPYPIYRESSNKFYIPRYFGISTFGVPNESRISKGIPINIKFAGKLRENQQAIVEKFLNHINASDTNSGGGGLLDLHTGFGKCLGKDTPILMYNGDIKMVQHIEVNDLLMGDDSTPRKVLNLARGRETMYKIIPHKGDPYIVNESHILSLKTSYTYSKKYSKGKIIDISVKDYLNLPKTFHGKSGRPLLGYKVPILYREQIVDFDPYLLGYWLGDGHSYSTQITTQSPYIIKYMIELFRSKEYIKYQLYLNYKYNYDYNIKSTIKKNYFIDFLKNNNLFKKHKNDNIKKHIPHNYKCNSRDIQLRILAGIIDSDGYNAKNCIEIILVNETLLDDIIFIARSLGFAAYKKSVKKSCIYKNEKRENIYYKTCIYGENLQEIPTLVPRKQCRKRKQIKDPLVNSIEIEKLDIDNYYGFTIDGNHRFLLGDYTVTHNTVLALNILTQIGLKTLIIVHKGFLVDQWVERITQFLPKARVGKIQAKVIDIEDKDIVIGMLQSLSMKDYPDDQFLEFGLTILDEIHHLSAEVFCRALQKICTRYTLGLSATMNRKDGLSKVFKMFIGDVIHKEKRDAENNVIVKAIDFNIDDVEFNEMEYDYRGNPKYSTMISKLCNFNIRSEFIINVIINELKINSNQQIMILGHNKVLLIYLYKAIEYRKIASVGYYIGGMKQNDLKISETKQVIIATYSMASEGLDIKTLTTLVLATPKTDIEQAVGRIMRVKDNSPLIIDIIDQHDIFKKQWAKRRVFYQKNNYTIMHTDNYNKGNPNWIEISKKQKGKGKNNDTTNFLETDNLNDIIKGKCLITL